MGGNPLMAPVEFFLCAACAAAAAACLVVVLRRRRERAAFWRTGGVEEHLTTAGRVAQLVAPLSQCVPARLLDLLSPDARKRTEALLLASGASDTIDIRAFVALRAAAAVAGCAWALVVLPGPVFVCAAAGIALGAAGPLAWLRARARRRRGAIERELPGALDWLALSVEAGEGFAQALGRIAAQLAPGLLRSELSRLDAAIRMGATRREALTAMARRAQVPAVSSLVALLVQADLLGTGIGPVLRVSAERLRLERFARAERAGVVAGQKALLPLVLCIMPATFVIVFGPLAVRVATGGMAALI